MNPATQEMLEKRIDEQDEQLQEMRKAMEDMCTLVLEDPHIDTNDEMYEKGDENAPFFSESYLYNLIGKEDARSVMARLHRVQEWLGMRDDDENPRYLADARERKRQHAATKSS